jgi:hypothetical protein
MIEELIGAEDILTDIQDRPIVTGYTMPAKGLMGRPLERSNIRNFDQYLPSDSINFMDFSSFEKAWKTAEMLSKAKCIPKEFWGNPADILVVVQFGYDLDIKPMTAIQNTMIINNRPAIWGDLMLAICMRTKGKEGGFIDCIETFDEENQTAKCIVKRDGREPLERTFSRKKAETAKLWGKVGQTGNASSWVTNPERMLQFRARGFALRDMFPDILKGVVSIEEMKDIENLENINNQITKNSEDTPNSIKERLKHKLNQNLSPNVGVELCEVINNDQ